MTSDQFRQHRIDLKLTQAALGEIMGMPARTISRIEYGARQPTNIQAAFIRHLVATKMDNGKEQGQHNGTF